MNKYTAFLIAYIAFVIASVVFFAIYINQIGHFLSWASVNIQPDGSYSENPFEVLSVIFTPNLIVSLIMMWTTALTFKIIGIVYVAKSDAVSGGEKALWIVGFCLIGFVTGIVFLILAKERKLV